MQSEVLRRQHFHSYCNFQAYFSSQRQQLLLTVPSEQCIVGILAARIHVLLWVRPMLTSGNGGNLGWLSPEGLPNHVERHRNGVCRFHITYRTTCLLPVSLLCDRDSHLHIEPKKASDPPLHMWHLPRWSRDAGCSHGSTGQM